jgi:hypothetical protein
VRRNDVSMVSMRQSVNVKCKSLTHACQSVDVAIANFFDMTHRHIDSWPASPAARICLHTRDVFTGVRTREDVFLSSRARVRVKTS